MKIIVIGAGPGALRLTMMLQSKGHDVHVYSDPLSAGVTLSFNLVISRLIQVLPFSA